MLSGAKKLSSGCGIGGRVLSIDRHCERAKQSISPRKPDRMDCFVASLLAMTAKREVQAERLNLTPHRSNPSPATLQPFAFAASRTLAISVTLNINPVIRSLAPLTKWKLALGS